MSHNKVGPDRFSRFDVYWIQTNKQTPKHPDKPNLYIDNPDRYENVYLLTRMQFCIHSKTILLTTNLALFSLMNQQL